MMAEFQTQKAFYDALTALSIQAYDSAPQQEDGASLAVFPCVEVGAIVMAPMDTKDKNGFDFVARLHTRSRSSSMKETKEIQSAMYDRFHHGDLNITGFRCILLRRETSDVTRAADGSFHGVCEYRGLIEAA